MKHLEYFLLLLVLSVLGDERPVKLESNEKAVIANCLELVRSDQLDDGAIRMKSDGDPIWIQPYFGAFGALALLASGEAKDVQRVSKWLDWYAEHQNQADGTIDDFEGGLRNGYHDMKKRDATDANASVFCLVAREYMKANGSLNPRVIRAVKLAVKALRSITDSDGLIWPKEHYFHKLFLDEIEDSAGLKAAYEILHFDSDPESKEMTRWVASTRRRLAGKLKTYWRPEESLFAYDLDSRGHYVIHSSVTSEVRQTLGLASLSGETWVSRGSPSLWPRLKGLFQPDSGLAPELPIERWYMAAKEVASPNEASTYRQLVIDEASTFTEENVYVHRPAVTVLALLRGGAWMDAKETPINLRRMRRRRSPKSK